jgi:hypothetical protein
MSQTLIKIKPYNPDNIRLNEDELTLIDNKMATPINSTYTAVKDLEGNGQDWIIEAVDKAFERIHERNCKKHEAELVKHSKKLRVHDWWLWALSAAVITIFAILILI